MIYLNKYEQVEYWLYTNAGDVYGCEETCDGLVWFDAKGWDVTSVRLCEKLTKARAESLAKMPKKVEIEAVVFGVGYYGIIDSADIYYERKKLYQQLQQMGVDLHHRFGKPCMLSLEFKEVQE